MFSDLIKKIVMAGPIFPHFIKQGTKLLQSSQFFFSSNAVSPLPLCNDGSEGLNLALQPG